MADFRLIIENRAQKDIKTAPVSSQYKIVQAITALSLEPRPRGCAKLKVQSGYRIRVGDYRILYTISDSKKIVTIYRVLKRDKAYR